MIIKYRGKEINLEQLSSGQFKKPDITQFTTKGRGCSWLDNCRIPYESEGDKKIVENKQSNKNHFQGSVAFMNELKGTSTFSKQGRFPANLLVSDDSLNDGKIRKSGKGVEGTGGKGKGYVYCEQLGKKKMGRCIGDSGSYSRYFSLDAWWKERIKKLPLEVQKVFPYLIVPKASKKEKNKGCEGLEEKIQKTTGKGIDNTVRKCPTHNECIPSGYRTYKCGCEIKYLDKDFDKPKKNHHPTVKPIKLMSYLITLGSKEGDVILDPFAGSCTTGIACKLLDRKFIGIEMEKEYLKIGMARIKGWNNE